MKFSFGLLFALMLLQQAVAQDSPPVSMGPGFQGGQQDTTATVRFSAPDQHIEDKAWAEQNGLQQAFVLDTNEPGDIRYRSAFIVAYQHRDDSNPIHRELNNFVVLNWLNYKQMFPDATTEPLPLMFDGPNPLAEAGFPYLFYSYRSHWKDEAGQEQSVGDGIALVFETPSGYWSVSWNAPWPLISQGLGTFRDFIAKAEIEHL